jgi:hypothetical protein
MDEGLAMDDARAKGPPGGARAAHCTGRRGTARLASAAQRVRLAEPALEADAAAPEARAAGEKRGVAAAAGQPRM